MNYTENYHLPQWEETDRIMRTDFNQMCADIESGLTRTAADRAETESLAWNALLRAGRRVLAEKLTEFDRTGLYCVNGLLFNPLTSAELAKNLSGTAWSEQLGIYAGRGEEIDPAILRESCTGSAPGHSNLDVTAGNAGSYYSFVAPLSGNIKGFSCYLLTFFGSSAPELMLDLTFTAEKKSGSTYVSIYRKNFRIERSGITAFPHREDIPMEVDFPIVKGTEYRLRLKPNASKKVLGRYGFLVEAVDGTDLDKGYIDDSKFVIRYPFRASASHSRSFPTEGPASRALAVVRYRKEEAASAVTPTLNGLSMTRLSDEARQDGDRAAYREAWFLLTKDLNENANWKVDLSAGGDDNVQLLEYAVMLL